MLNNLFSSPCSSLLSTDLSSHHDLDDIRRLSRTSKAILAVNGFAADGNNFVKRVKQRLEVRPPSLSSLVITILGRSELTINRPSLA